MNDPYSVLGITRDATESEVKAAYHRLAKRYHPDLNSGDKAAEEQFKRVNTAYEEIRSGRADQPPPRNHHGRSDPFEFGFGFGSAGWEEVMNAFHARQHQRNRDLAVECSITLEDAFTGTEASIRLQLQGETRVVNIRIPPGIQDGQKLRIPQAGDRSFTALAPGDLYVIVNVRPHGSFRREGANLIVSQEIGIFDLLLGASLRVTGLDGSPITVTVPPLTRDGVRLPILGHGMPHLNDRTVRGNLLVELRAAYPVSLTDEQMDLLAKAKSCGRST